MVNLLDPWSVYNTPWFARPGYEPVAQAWRNPQRKLPVTGRKRRRKTKGVVSPSKVRDFFTGELRMKAGARKHRANGYVIYRGPSLFDGKPIVVIATGFRDPSDNEKTGPMIQTWILREDIHPQEALWSEEDVSICGACPLRGNVTTTMKRRWVERKVVKSKVRPGFSYKEGGRPSKRKTEEPKMERPCYVVVSQAPLMVFKNFHDGKYPEVPLDQLPDLFRATWPLRIGSYGDPLAVPAEVWEAALTHQVVWTGYTHSWLRPGSERYRGFLMASVDNKKQAKLAQSKGWRTFRVALHAGDGPIAGKEIVCPATPEGGGWGVVTCDACNKCMGAEAEDVECIVVAPHGSGAKYLIDPSVGPVYHDETRFSDEYWQNPGHDHPRLPTPVPRHSIVSELYEMYERGGLPGDPVIGWPNALTKLHEKHPRRYAQVHAPAGPLLFAGAGRPRFEFAEQTRWLPKKHRTGLIAHEVGHALAVDGSEEAADQAAEQHLGVRIGYDKRWPGRGLQVARGNPPTRRQRKYAGRRQGMVPDFQGRCRRDEAGRREWIEELARRTSDESHYPRLGTEGTEAEDYYPRLCGDYMDIVLQAMASGGEGDRYTVMDLERVTGINATGIKGVLGHLESKGMGLVRSLGKFPKLDARGRMREEEVWAVTAGGAIAASWERQAAALKVSEWEEEARNEESMARAAREAELKSARSKLHESEEKHRVIVTPMPNEGMLRFDAYAKDPFGVEDIQVGTLWLRITQADDRAYGPVRGGYAEVAHVYVSPQYRREFVATLLHQAAAQEAWKLEVPLRMASGLHPTPGEREFWLKQTERGRAVPFGYRGPEGLALTRFFLNTPPPPMLHNPRRRSMEPVVGPMLRRRR